MKYLLLIFVVLTGCVKVLPQDARPLGTGDLQRTENAQSKWAAENGYNHISNDTNIKLIESLPDELGEWATEPERYVINYERRQHGLGYSKKYNEGPRRPIWADIYFFHARQEGMSDGIESKQFRNLWKESKQEPSWVSTCNVKDKTDTIVTFGGMKFRKCQLVTSINDKDYDSMMFMTVAHGTFLKVRISYRPGYKDLEREVDSFMNDLVRTLNKNVYKDPGDLYRDLDISGNSVRQI